jgi:hypothetical protein
MTYDDLNDHPFAIHMATESFVSDSERAWLKWVKKVEKLLGHDLDGNQDCDGYSLDGAYAAWETGVTAEAMVAEIKAEPLYNPANSKPIGTGAPR